MLYHLQAFAHAVLSEGCLLHRGLLKSDHPLRFFFFINYLFLTALGLHCCARAFSSCRERGLLFVVVRGLLIALASLVAEHGL